MLTQRPQDWPRGPLPPLRAERDVSPGGWGTRTSTPKPACRLPPLAHPTSPGAPAVTSDLEKGLRDTPTSCAPALSWLRPHSWGGHAARLRPSVGPTPLGGRRARNALRLPRLRPPAFSRGGCQGIPRARLPPYLGSVGALPRPKVRDVTDALGK